LLPGSGVGSSRRTPERTWMMDMDAAEDVRVGLREGRLPEEENGKKDSLGLPGAELDPSEHLSTS